MWSNMRASVVFQPQGDPGALPGHYGGAGEAADVELSISKPLIVLRTNHFGTFRKEGTLAYYPQACIFCSTWGASWTTVSPNGSATT
jgi:hypothetical protein